MEPADVTVDTTKEAGAGSMSPASAGSVLRPRMTVKELIERKADIQRQARDFMACKENVFPGLPEEERWKHCVAMVADIWLWLGPQRDHTPNTKEQAHGTR